MKTKLYGKIISLILVIATLFTTLPFTVFADAAEIEKNKGTQFDPEMVDKFIELLQKKKLQIRYSDVVLEERQDV